MPSVPVFIQHAVPAVAIAQIQSDGQFLPRNIPALLPRYGANLLHCRSPLSLVPLSTSITWERTASRPETGLLIPSVFNSYHPFVEEVPVANQRIAAAGNTVVPALLALRELGFSVTVDTSPERQTVVAARGHEEFVADDPVSVLGLIKLVEIRTWNWEASDEDIAASLEKYQL